jgi:hypothetical protein
MTENFWLTSIIISLYVYTTFSLSLWWLLTSFFADYFLTVASASSFIACSLSHSPFLMCVYVCGKTFHHHNHHRTVIIIILSRFFQLPMIVRYECVSETYSVCVKDYLYRILLPSFPFSSSFRSFFSLSPYTSHSFGIYTCFLYANISLSLSPTIIIFVTSFL